MKQGFHRKSVISVVWCLKSIGVIVQQRKISLAKFYQYVAVYPFFFAFISISLYVIRNLRQVNEAVIAAAYLGGSISMLSSIIIFTRKRKEILKTLQLIDANVYAYPDENIIIVKMHEILQEKNVLKFLLLIMVYECFGFSLGILSPFFAFFLTGVYEVKMFPAWYPWETRETFSVILTTVVQFTGCMSAFWVMYVIQVLIGSITIEFMRQCQRLRTALSSVQKRTADAVFERKRNLCVKCSTINQRDEFRNRYNVTYRTNILHCVKHYQQLWKLFRWFESWFSLYYSIELAMSAATFALAFYNVLVSWSPSMFLTIIGSTFSALANLFSRCIVGEIFSEMNIKIMNVIFYDMYWWEQSIQNKKLLLLFHTICKRSHELKGYSVFTASYFTFSQLMRMSYSYFNIIRSTLRKK